jgi:hypothetical protein
MNDSVKKEQPRAPNQAQAKPYVQFSKKMVVAVTIAATTVCLLGRIRCACMGNTDGLVEIVKAFISYALVAFAAYSGNSAVEKWLVKKYSAGENTSE